jgi:hypothetical protein
MRIARLAVVFLAYFGVFYIPAFSQQTGEIRGKVSDESGEALPGVSITARSQSLQGMRNAVSDADGEFRLPLLSVGTYSLTYELDGFEKLTTLNNEVRLGFTMSVSVILKMAAISEEVTVKAENPLIDKANADNSYRLKSDDLSTVPSQARTIEEVVSFTPGVTGVRDSSVTGRGTGLPSFRGEGESGNNWLVDGLSIKGVQDSDPGVRINFDAWEEVQIISDGFDPSLGQSAGGFINVITKSGGNAFHGEIGILIRDWHLRAKRQDQLAVVSEPDTSLHQFYGNLGGSIVKDRLWFFISDNFHRTLDDAAQQSIGWLTIPPGSRRYSSDNIFGKLTYTFQKNHTLALSGTLDKSLNQTGGIGVPETYVKTDYEDYSYRINYRGILSQDTLVTAAWGENKQSSAKGPLSGDYGPPSYDWLDIGQTTNNIHFTDGEIQRERRSDVSLEITHYLDLGGWGDHEMGGGFIYYDNHYESEIKWTGQDFDPWEGNGFDAGTSIGWISPGLPYNLFESARGYTKSRTKGIGLHIKDRFTIGRLSFMLGLRAETQEILDDLGETVWRWGLGDFLSPRFSLTFDLLGNGNNIIKFGYAQFKNTIVAGKTLSFFSQNYISPQRIYTWKGGIDPTQAQLADPSNWEFLFENSAENAPIEVDPDLKPNRTSRFLLEFDRRLGNSWALKLRGVYSSSKNLTEDIGLYNPENPDFPVRFFFTNFELKRREYRGIEFEINGRISGKFTLNAAYTWSQAKGTIPGNWVEWVTWQKGWGQLYDLGIFGDHPYVPEGQPGKEFIDFIFSGLGGRGIGDEGWYGFLPYSADHQIKILGTYMARYGINIAVSIEYLSGYHWEKKGLSEAIAEYGTFPEGRGVRTAPAHMYMDLSVEKDFVLSGRFVLGLGFNVYNLLDSQRPISFVKEDTEFFGQVWGRQLPRWFQFKASLRF